MAPKDVANAIITTTPKTLLMILATTVSAYIYVFATFATVEQMDEVSAGLTVQAEVIASDLQMYIEIQELRTLEYRRLDLKDKIWEQEQLDSDTPENRKRVYEWKKQIESLDEDINCIHAGGRHCTAKQG